jgi:hypothetical protein
MVFVAIGHGDNLHYSVTHEGVPIGTVELPDQRTWSGGSLVPLPAFERVRPALAAVAELGAGAVERLLFLAADTPIDGSPTLAEAARLRFGLTDPAGHEVPVGVVRVAIAAADRRPRVLADFRLDACGSPAQLPRRTRRDGDSAEPGP